MTQTRALMVVHVLTKDQMFINACVRTASAEKIVKVSILFVDLFALLKFHYIYIFLIHRVIDDL